MIPTNAIIKEKTPMALIQQAPEWMKKIWRTTTWDKNKIEMIIANANAGTLLATGMGAIRNEWGAYYWGFVMKEKLKRISTQNGPVDGNSHHMKIFRASATYVLSAISILTTLEPWISNTNDPIHIHTCNTQICALAIYLA